MLMLIFFIFFSAEEAQALQKHLHQFYQSDFRKMKPSIWSRLAITDVDDMRTDVDSMNCCTSGPYKGKNAKDDIPHGDFGSWRILIGKMDELEPGVKPDQEMLHRIYLHGRHKSGKTVTVKKLALEWAKRKCTKNNPKSCRVDKYDYVFFIQLTQVKPGSSLVSTIQEQLLDGAVQISEEDLTQFIESQQMKVLIVLDDFNDFGVSLSPEFEELISGLRLPKATVIITSSPLMHGEVVDKNTHHYQITEDSMHPHHILHFIAMFYKQKFSKMMKIQNKEVANLTRTQLEAKGLIFWLLNNQQHCYEDKESLYSGVMSWICILWHKTQAARIQSKYSEGLGVEKEEECPGMPMREVKVTEAIINHIITRDLENAHSASSYSVTKENFDTLGRRALQGIQSIIGTDPISFNLDDIPLPLHQSGLLELAWTCKAKMLPPSRQLRFIHPLFAYYFAATFLAHTCTNNYIQYEILLQSFKSITQLTKIVQTLKFLCGFSQQAATGLFERITELGRQSPCLGPLFEKPIDPIKISQMYYKYPFFEMGLKRDRGSGIDHTVMLNNMCLTLLDEYVSRGWTVDHTHLSWLVALTGQENVNYGHLLMRLWPKIKANVRIWGSNQKTEYQPHEWVQMDMFMDKVDECDNIVMVYLNGSEVPESVCTTVLGKLKGARLQGLELWNIPEGCISAKFWKTLDVSRLEVLSLYKMEINIDKIINVVNKARKLCSLTLEDTKMKYLDVMKLLKALKDKPHLTNLNLSENMLAIPLDPHEFEIPEVTVHPVLANYFQFFPNLRSLELSKTSLTANALCALVSGLPVLQHLKKLRLSSNGLMHLDREETGFEALVNLFKGIKANKALRTLSFHSIYNDPVAHIEENYHDLEMGTLSHVLCGSLQHLPNVRRLGLGNLRILHNQYAIKNMIDTLRYLPNMEHLDVSDNIWYHFKRGGAESQERLDRLTAAVRRWIPKMICNNGYGTYWVPLEC